MNRISKRVDMQVAILLSIFVVVVSTICLIVTYNITYSDMRASLSSRVETIYKYLEEKLDMSTFSGIDSRADIEQESYQNMRDLFSTVRESSGVMYLYTAKKTEDGKYVYVIDGLDMDSEDFRYPGDPIEEEIFDEMDRAMNGEEVYPKNILHTSWGDIFICYLPVMNQGEVIGVLGIEFEASHHYMTYRMLKRFIPIYILIFTLISFAVSRKLFERISNPAFKDMANTDFLTGLCNRNAYQLAIDNLLAMNQMEKMGVAVIDLNNLKRVNDNYGHSEGDHFICTLAEAHNQVEGKKGTLYRIGGDEFVILMEDCTEPELEQMIKAVISNFDRLKREENLSFSYGCRVFNPSYDETLTDTYQRADMAMYLFKRRYYEQHSESRHYDLRHHRIQQSVIRVLSYGYASYQVVDWDTENLIDYGIYDERLCPMMEEKIIYTTYSEGIGLYFVPLLMPENREETIHALAIETVREVLMEQNHYVVQSHLFYEGQEFWLQLCFFRLLETEGRMSFIIAYRDVTEQVCKEEKQKQLLKDALYNAEVASKAKTNFLFNMSHDIRTPMNAIIGFTQIAQNHIDDKAMVYDSLQKVEHASDHLLRLINDILDMARIESGQMDVKMTAGSIRDAVMESYEVFQQEMEEKRITFLVECEVEDDYLLYDQLHVRQVAWNLLSNALKYTNSGGTVLYQIVQTGKDEEGFGYYEMHVKDNGIGMSEEFQTRVFDIFERERCSTESGVEGAGLGLAITKRIVDLLGGTIEVHSETDVGSEFIVRWRTKILNEKQPGPKVQANNQAPEHISLAGKRILLAEDNDLNREIAEVVLSEQGFEIESVSDGLQAVEKVAGSEPGYFDLVLMDIQMPNMNGYEATAQIRRLANRSLAKIPIIAMTANAFDEDKKKAKEAGMDGHIAKPIDVAVLVETLSKLLS